MAGCIIAFCLSVVVVTAVGERIVQDTRIHSVRVPDARVHPPPGVVARRNPRGFPCQYTIYRKGLSTHNSVRMPTCANIIPGVIVQINQPHCIISLRPECTGAEAIGLCSGLKFVHCSEKLQATTQSGKSLYSISTMQICIQR